MTNTLLDISRKIDSSRLGVIELVHGACARLEIPLMLVGALARDIHFSLANEIHPRRTTMDVDFAVLVEDWAKFDRLTGSLTKIVGISQSAGRPDRFTGADRTEFDVIPFGEVENPAGRIAWPPDYGRIMSTVGFSDALESSVLCRLRIDPALEIRIVSISGLAMLKLISWHDGYPNRTKDAQDLLFILQHYLDTGQQNRLYESDIMNAPNFDYERAGARLLGRDIADMANPDTKETILGILDEELREGGRARFLGNVSTFVDEDPGTIFGLLGAFRAGIAEWK